MHGPHLQNQRSQARILEPLGVLRRVASAAELAPLLEELWADPERNEAALRAGNALEAHRGAAGRALEVALALRTRALGA